MAMGIVSSLVYTTVDQGGVTRTEGWFLLSIAENYATGGIGLDLSDYFSFIETGTVQNASGAINFIGRINDADLPASTQSGANSVTSLKMQQLMGGTGSSVAGFLELTTGTDISGLQQRLHIIGY